MIEDKIMIKRGFASDNNAGAHPEILKELARINAGHEIGYGGDRYTAEARELFKQHLGSAAEVYFVFTGTAANVIGISSVAR